MCQKSCIDCEHAVFLDYGGLCVRPAYGVQVYEDGKPAKAIPVRVRVARVIPVVEGEGRN